ncbi:MAG: intradiol ring-cleavage dioxygenase [Burkholderiaceae bacterium]
MLTSRKSLAQSLPATPACGSRTPPQMEGPFFTPLSPERASLLEADMRGPRMVLKGQVVDSACRPLAGALLDFWQCDDQGRYDNQGYRLRGHQFANRQGAFSLSTLLPGEYPGRTPHLHVKVQPANGRVLTTQLYLPDHPRNQRDFLFDPRLVVSKKDDGFYFQFVV